LKYKGKKQWIELNPELPSASRTVPRKNWIKTAPPVSATTVSYVNYSTCGKKLLMGILDIKKESRDWKPALLYKRLHLGWLLNS
jgi:hypothetical protein